jgi:hypothetical protein
MKHYYVVTHEHTYTVTQDGLGELLTELQADLIPVVDVSKADGHACASLANHSAYVVDHSNPDWSESAMLGE